MTSSKQMCLQDTEKELRRRKQESVNRYFRKQIFEHIKQSHNGRETAEPIIIRYNVSNNMTDITLETMHPENDSLVIFQVHTSQIEIFAETYGYIFLKISGKIFLYVEENIDVKQFCHYIQRSNRIYCNSCLKRYINSNKNGHMVVFSTFGAITMFYANTDQSDDIVLLPKDVIYYANKHHYSYKKYLADNYFGVAKIVLFLQPFDKKFNQKRILDK